MLMISFTGCNKKVPTTEHKVMLEVRNMNWSEVNANDDYWAGSNWTVYYDGIVKFHNDYNLSGVTDEKKWTLNEKQRNKLYQILTSSFKRYTEDRSAADGTGWQFTFYSDGGQILHEFIGYIYNNKTMNKIVSIIDPQDVE